MSAFYGTGEGTDFKWHEENCGVDETVPDFNCGADH